MSSHHNVSFGQVTYAPDAPADAPTWIWKCECRKCRKARKRTGDLFLGMHGPFQTLEEAQAHCEKVLTADTKPGEAKAFFTTDEATLRLVEENGEPVLYVEKDFKRIAKRYPGGKLDCSRAGLHRSRHRARRRSQFAYHRV